MEPSAALSREEQQRLLGPYWRNYPGQTSIEELQVAWEGQDAGGPSGLMSDKAVASSCFGKSQYRRLESLGVMKEVRWERSTWEQSQGPKRDEEEREHWWDPEKWLRDVGKRRWRMV